MEQMGANQVAGGETPNISVCIAAYNGERFIQQQIASVLSQLTSNDEIVIVDDCSTDRTVSAIASFNDPRILLIQNERNSGVVRTFERALANSRNELLFLCDQDDLWRADKVQQFKNLFCRWPNLSLAASDATISDAEGHITSTSFVEIHPFYPGILRNLARNRYLGCTMVLRRSLLAYCLPFPSDIPMHDVWIGMVNRLVGKSAFIADQLVMYRRHGKNATSSIHAPMAQMLRWRFALIKNLARMYFQRVVFRRPRLNY
jgi:glycosyltransferase involved in cell wall biosynthesis